MDFSDEGWVGDGVSDRDGGASGSRAANVGEGEGVSMVKTIAIVGGQGCTRGAGLCPFDTAASGIEVTQGPVCHGNGKATGVEGGSGRREHCGVHWEGEGLTTVRYTFPALLLGEDLSDDRGEFFVGGGDEAGVNFAESPKERGNAG